MAPPLVLLGGYTLGVEGDELVARRGASKLSRQRLCSGSLLDPLAAAVTVLGGETYDAVTKTVHAAPGWFTLACAGSAAAKVKLLGYGSQSKFPGTT